MAEETHKAAAPETPAQKTEEVVVVSDVAVVEKKDPPPAPEPEPEALEKLAATVEEVMDAEKPEPAAADEEKITESASFKEETNVVGELPDPQKKAIDELKQLVQEALNKHEFTTPPPPPAKEMEQPADPPAEEIPPAPATEEEPKPEEKSEAAEPPADTPTPPSAAVAEEPPKSEPEAAVPPAEEDKTPPPPPPAAESSEPVVVHELVEKVAAVVDEDGAKTVEAIEETIVAVSAPPAPAAEAPPAKPKEEPEALAAPPPPPEEVSIWGIPLLADERSDVILLKFLRARDFKVKEAFAMLKNTVRWRKEFGIESLLEEDLGTELDKSVFMHGFDKEGHPVCYNAYGEFQNKELYQNTFSDEEKRQKFLRWRIQFLEKSIVKLDFSPDGICTFVQINDLKNSPGLFKRELRLATDQALQLLQDNYPEFVAKQVFINVPWWYLAFYRMISPFFTQRTKSKFVFAGPSKSAETLFKYISPEQVPAQYGGLSREGEREFTTADPVKEETIKPASKHTVEFPISEACSFVWEVRVVGWDVSYGAEFVPGAEGGYTVIIQKSRKILPADETVICGSYKTTQPGKVVLTFDNQTSKKKKLLYRTKTKLSD
ncbi:Patellin-3 like [Actinidia chinensis var. chinensis]|uniref:Patellin-3 like n=1 Tax=Actinidia chinensis var. chinensis TaxID=1590841 RepID=A0A2R6RP15_ACTCC|nr:Patellin-3 like [Actinidia chinensis var. chinensis]